MDPETSTPLEQLHKSIQTFEELALGAVHRDNLWRYSDAFMQSLRSILEDNDCNNEEKRKYFDTTLDQYTEAMKNLFDNIIGQAALIKSDAERFDEIEEVEKFNPYHDSQGRFSSADSFAHFTIRTKDPNKQHWADAAMARERQRDADGLVPGPAPRKPAEAHHPVPTPTTTTTNLPGGALKTCREVEAKTVNRKTEKMTLVSELGTVVLEKNGGKGSVRFGDHESAQMGPTITLTHNHPGDFGGTFSGSDVSVLTKYDLRGIRAVGKEGTYSLERTHQSSRLNARSLDIQYNKQSDAAIRSLKSDFKAMKGKVRSGEMTADEANKQLAEKRTAHCNALHDWLIANSATYGYNYVFEPAGGVGKMLDIEKDESAENSGEEVLDGDFLRGDSWMITDDTDE